MEVVNKGCVSRPDESLKLLSPKVLNENISFVSNFISLGLHANSCVNDRHVVVPTNDVRHVFKGEILFVNCEIIELVHVVDVAPDSIKRNLQLFIFFEDTIEGLSRVVSPL